VHEAVGDWWLLGETDLAVLGPQTVRSRYNSFARSAFARGARTRSLFYVPASECAYQETIRYTAEERAACAQLAAAAAQSADRLVQCGAEAEYAPMWGAAIPNRDS
jgi:hypothetical protein